MEDISSLIGSLFAGRFRIESLLGSGGMGAVYLGYHEVLQRRFAIKVIKSNLVSDVNIAARFRREARAASRINHPHITYVTDFGHTGEGRPYLVMEYVEGPTLAEVLAQEGALSLSRAIGIMAQIADALAAAHADHVVHRDLKPKNILLTTHRGRRDHVKILDFGLAKIMNLGRTDGLTRDGDTFGTPQYMSPELCVAQAADHRTDIYSFGVIAFELLVGHAPFDGSVMMEIINAHVQTDPPLPSASSGRVDIPGGLDALVLRCLAKNPDDRYQTADALFADIHRLQQATGDPAPLKPQRSGLLVVERRRRTDDLSQLDATLPPLFPSDEDDERTVEDDEDRPKATDTWSEPTESDWPVDVDLGPGARRSSALEELAYALRDRGIGSAAISQVLSLKLEADDRVLDIECDLAVIEAQAAEMEARAQDRESRLRRALNQLEHERAMLQPAPPEGRGGDPLEDTLRWGNELSLAERGALDADLEARSAEITERIRQIQQQLEQGLAALHQSLDQMQQMLEQARGDVRRYEDQLAELLAEARPAVVELAAPELVRLLSLAEV